MSTANNLLPNSSTAMQSSFTVGPQKQDSQQQAYSVSIDVSLGVSQTSQPNGIIKVGGHQGNFLNASKIIPVSTKSRPTM